MKFDKLVRDKYPEILGKKGKFRTADEEEYKQKLREKIVEEAEELQGSVSKEELADVLEAIECYIEAEKWDRKEIDGIKKEKNSKKGSFRKRTILVESE